MSKRTDPLVAVVGCGYWGRNLARVFHELESLGAVCDLDPEVARGMASRFHVPARSFEEVLLDPSIPAVCLATPAAMHHEHARAALEAGKHVFVEKPLALEVEMAEELTHLSGVAGKVLMVGHLMRFHPCFKRLERAVQEGDLGPLRYVYSTRLNLGRFRREENILWSFAPHDVSMILALVGDEPSGVVAVGSSHRRGQPVDVTTTHLTFPDGIHAHIFVSWLHPFKEQRLVVIGEKAMAVFDDAREWDEKLVVYRHEVDWRGGVDQPGRAEPVSIAVPSAEPLREECSHFLDCVRGDTRPITDAEEATRVLRVLHRAQVTMNESNVV